MKRCELCKSPARLYCESDQASLCWDCDAKVHFANFLVARHCRNLLCHVCQTPTAWTASGSKLGKTISVCEACTDRGGRREEESEGDNGDDETDTEDEYEDEDEDDDDDEEEEEEEEEKEAEEDGDNQVVPWSSSAVEPPASSDSSSEESSGGFGNGVGDDCLKRMRENDSDLRSDQDDDDDSTFCRRNCSPPSAAAEGDLCGGKGGAAFVDSNRPMKSRRIEAEESGRGSAAIVESLKKFHEQGVTSGKSPRAVDFDYSESS